MSGIEFTSFAQVYTCSV